MSSNNFADQYNALFFDENGDPTNPVVEIKLRSGDIELHIPGISTYATNRIEELCHAYAKWLRNNPPTDTVAKDAAPSDPIVSSLEIEWSGSRYICYRRQSEATAVRRIDGAKMDEAEEATVLAMYLKTFEETE